jgi:single-strand DNA-binding protein
MNKIMLIGNLGRDPEMNYTPNGTAVTRFSLAVNRVTKSASGERQEETQWFNIVAWQKLAETCNTYLHKGSKIFIEGRLQTRKYTDNSGIERTTVEVIASGMEMLTPKERQAESGADAFLGEEDAPAGDEYPF